MFKRVICFLSAVMVAASTSFAADDVDPPWVEVPVSFNYVYAQPCVVDASGSDTSFIVGDDGTLSESLVEFSSNRYEYSWDTDLSVSVSGSTYSASRPVYSLHTSDSYVSGKVEHNVSYTKVSVGQHVVYYDTTLSLPAGYYEIDVGADCTGYLNLGSSSSSFRPTFSQVSFYMKDLDGQPSTSPFSFVPLNNLYHYHGYIYLPSDTHVTYFFSFSSYSFDFPFSGGNDISSNIKYSVVNPYFRYRTVDPADVTALNQANQQAGGTMQDYDSTEQQFTQSMTDNFNALNLSDFTFPSGLLSGFTLVTSLFEQLWSGLGEYKILYVFPLTLGIVLLLIGRISKSSGGQSSRLTDRGDDDA